MKYWILSFILATAAGCTSHEDTAVQPTSPPKDIDGSQIELREDLSATDFKKALIGKWTSVFTYQSRPNVQQAEFRTDGTAAVVIIHNGKKEELSGTFKVDFEREPNPGMVTFARITISGEKPIELKRVNFGLHNGVHWNLGPLLRIDTEPRGVLKKITN